MLNKIGIMGAGSLGTILGAMLTRAGRDVTFIDAYKEHVDTLNEKGATVEGTVSFTVPAKAMMSDAITGKFDLMIYMAKQTYNDIAIPQMIAALKPESIICCCQNGIPEYEVAKYWPESQICGAPVNWGATFKGPGRSELTSAVSANIFHLGTLDGKDHPWIYEVKEILEDMCPVIMSPSLLGERWSKVLVNAAWSGMSTVTGGTFGDVMDDDDGARCLAMIAQETVKSANANGIMIDPVGPPGHQLDLQTLSLFTDKEGFEGMINAFRQGMIGARPVIASMLQDLQKGRKCEISQIDGVVAETGDKAGVDTPFTDKVIEIVQAIERGEKTVGWHNMAEFKPLIEKYCF